MQTKIERVFLAKRALLMSKVARVDNDIKSISQKAGVTHLARLKYDSLAGCGWCCDFLLCVLSYVMFMCLLLRDAYHHQILTLCLVYGE